MTNSPGQSTERDRARLARLSASAVADATAGVGVISGLRRYSGSGVVVGQAVTAEGFGGSMYAVFDALEHARAGDVLCLTAPGPTAYLGDLLASQIIKRGLSGGLIDGLIRDTDAIAGFSASFFARGTTPTARRGGPPGRSMVPIQIGGVQIMPGDWVIADGDGAVVVPAADLDDVLARAEENARIEELILARVEAGASVPDAVREVTGALSGSTRGGSEQ